VKTKGFSSKPVEELVKSRQRVANHGEVFTPSWMVESMLDLVKIESERVDSRFLEPACGTGNFLKVVLGRKLNTVQKRYGKSDFERRHHALFSLMCIYGIDLLEDNVQECREILLNTYMSYLDLERGDVWHAAGYAVLKVNIVQGDALTLTTSESGPIEFPEWAYLGAGKFQRRDFRYDALTQRSLYDPLTQRSSDDGALFEMVEDQGLFVPTKTHSQMTVADIS